MSKRTIEVVDGDYAAFNAGRRAAWNRLGVVTEGAVTADEALRLAKLDWNVEKHPIQTVVATAGGVSTIDVANKFATVRMGEDGFKPLGIVGNRYQILQNSEAFAFCNNLVDEGGAVFDSAGSLHGGRKVFITMRLPEQMLVGGQDVVNHYLLVTSTHDGTEPLIAAISSIRFACTNAISSTVRGAKQKFVIRHSSSLDGRLQEARNALQLSWKYENEFQELADELISQPMTDSEWVKFMDAMFPLKKEEPSKKAITLNETLKSDLMGIWNADTQANIANTRWAAYNTVVEYVDWFAPVKGKQDADNRRAERLMDGLGQSLKHRTLKALVSA